ncbi:MAG TPA: PAS domain-containing protein [Pseudonocardiaceae bacterium]
MTLLSPGSPGVIDLYRATDLMQEAAVVLAWPTNPSGPAIGDCCARHMNDRARRALRAPGRPLANVGLLELVTGDAARTLHQVCAEALRTGRSTEHFAVAPDPITDLAGSPSIAVRATRVDGAVLCTWVPGWHVVGEEEDRRLARTIGMPIADRLELADTLDMLGEVGLGVFSVNLMTGRVVWSAGLYEIFGRPHQNGPMDIADWRLLTEPDPVVSGAWRALIRDGRPADVELRLIPSLGGHWLRVTAHAVVGPDGHPAAIRGRVIRR